MCKLLNGKSFLFAALLLSAISMSCSHDPHDENQDPSNTDVHEWEDSTLSGDAVMGSAMTFKVGGGMSVERTAQTRATTDINGIATFTEGDFVAVAVTRSGGSEVVKLYQVKSDGSLEYAGGDNDPFVWKSTGETVSLRAWSYGTSTNLSYTLTAPETRDYTLETDQQTNDYRELLYCKAADKSYSSGAISLNFYHQLARMVFNVTHESSSPLTISSVSIGGSSFPKTARFIVPTDGNVGTWVVKSGTGSITPRTETPTTGYLATYSAVVFPTFTTQNYPKDTPFFTVTSGTYNYTYKIAESEGMTYAGNTQYNYTINVKDDGLIFYPSTYTAADITYGDYYSVTSTGQPVLVKNSAVTDAINAGITPKAVVFALPSEMNAADRAKWPHAYAMALKEAGTAVAWSTRTNVAVQSSSHTFTAGNTGLFTDMGGYEATHNITDRNSTDPTNFNATTYPAFFAALNYDTAPAGSSGWFLPTNGQWERIVRNLGGMTSTPISASTSNYLSGQATTAATNINRYLNFNSSIATKIQRQYNTLERMYWCSGEYDASRAWVTTFDNSNGMFFSYVTTKTTTNFEDGVNYSRACIAF